MDMTKLVTVFRNSTDALTILTLFQTGLIKERTVDNIVKIQRRVDKYLTPKEVGYIVICGLQEAILRH